MGGWRVRCGPGSRPWFYGESFGSLRPGGRPGRDANVPPCQTAPVEALADRHRARPVWARLQTRCWPPWPGARRTAGAVTLADDSERVAATDAIDETEPLYAVLRVALSPSNDAPRQARQAAREALAEHVTMGQLDDVVLMISELVSNAVRHPVPESEQPVELEVGMAADRIHAEVTDSGRGLDAAARRHGLGLEVVDLAASRWGVLTEAPYCVWFELDRGSGR